MDYGIQIKHRVRDGLLDGQEERSTKKRDPVAVTIDNRLPTRS